MNFFRVYIEGDAATLTERHLELAEQTGTWLWGGLTPSAIPGIATTELHIWENGMAFDLDKLEPFLAQLLS